MKEVIKMTIPLPLSGQQIVGMIIHYYKKYEEKDVTVNLTCGKVVSGKKYVPTTGVVHFDVSEVIRHGQYAEIKRVPLFQAELEDIIATVLRESNFAAQEIHFNTDSNYPLNFTGVTVIGERMFNLDEYWTNSKAI